MNLSLNYSILKRPKAIMLTTAIVVVIYNVLFYFHPSNQQWLGSDEFSWTNLLKFILIDQFLIELITTGIVFYLIWIYAHRLKLYCLELNPKSISNYLFKFLPPLLIAFFAFNPITQSVRYILVEGLPIKTDLYLNEYVLNFKLYPVYLVPVILSGFGILTFNLVQLYNVQLRSTSEEVKRLNQPEDFLQNIIARDDWGEVPVKVYEVIWFEKSERKYFANTLKGKLRMRETISELESALDPSKFVRINRSVIVNISHILNYSFWENEKYVLRLRNKEQTEFIMSRERLNKIKAQLKLTQ